MKTLTLLILLAISFSAMGQTKCDSCKMFDLYHSAFMSNNDYAKHDSLYYNSHLYFGGCMRQLIAEQKKTIKKLSHKVNIKNHSI